MYKMSCVDRDHWTLSRVYSKSARILFINNAASGKYHYFVFFTNGNWQMLPMYEVLAYRMSPAHVSPNIAERVVLIEEMVFSFVVYQSIGVVRPVGCWGKMNLRPIPFFV